MDETLNIFDKVLSLGGIKIFTKQKYNEKTWLIFQIFNCFIGFQTMIFTTGFMVVNSNDLPLLIEGACIWTTAAIMFISLALCLKFRKKLRLFLFQMAFKDTLLDMPLLKMVMTSMMHGEKTTELRSLVINTHKKMLKLIAMLLKMYVMGVFMTVVLYICDSIYRMVITEDESLRILAFEMWFPWSLNNFKVYTASFIFHAYAALLCCIGMFYFIQVDPLVDLPIFLPFIAYPGFQSTIILLMAQTIRQLKVITFIITNLHQLCTEMVKNGDENGQCQLFATNVLSQCVVCYVKLKRFNNQINKIFRLFYLALLLIAIMLVCVCSVKIALSNKLSLEVLKYYVHEFCFVMVVLLFCSIGQQIQNECDKLEQAVFVKWYKFNREHQKHLLIFKMALSQSMPVTIFGSITLSLPTFTWFIKTGASFFTLMMSFLE